MRTQFEHDKAALKLPCRACGMTLGECDLKVETYGPANYAPVECCAQCCH